MRRLREFFLRCLRLSGRRGLRRVAAALRAGCGRFRRFIKQRDRLARRGSLRNKQPGNRVAHAAPVDLARAVYIARHDQRGPVVSGTGDAEQGVVVKVQPLNITRVKRSHQRVLSAAVPPQRAQVDGLIASVLFAEQKRVQGLSGWRAVDGKLNCAVKRAPFQTHMARIPVFQAAQHDERAPVIIANHYPCLPSSVPQTYAREKRLRLDRIRLAAG